MRKDNTTTDADASSSDPAAALPSLFEANGLMAFLQSELSQLESLSGEEDKEARMLLQQLEQQTAVLQEMTARASNQQQQPQFSELELAAQLDR